MTNAGMRRPGNEANNSCLLLRRLVLHHPEDSVVLTAITNVCTFGHCDLTMMSYYDVIMMSLWCEVSDAR